MSDVVVGGEEGNAIIDGGDGRRSGRGECDGNRVALGDAIAWSVAVSGGGRSGGEGGVIVGKECSDVWISGERGQV